MDLLPYLLKMFFHDNVSLANALPFHRIYFLETTFKFRQFIRLLILWM